MTRKEKISLVLFIVALALALFFFGRGIFSATNKESGFYEMNAKEKSEAGTYSKGISLSYFLDGKSNDIKTAKMEIENCYSDALLRAYELTDPEKEYEGLNNLCTINKNPGKEIKVGEDLYSMLQDAYGKTLEKKGFSMFAGSYYTHWNSILSLSEPQEFDPLFNEDEKERLDSLLAETLSEDAFSLEFKADNTVVFNVSEDYLNYLADREESLFCLDFNLLREAYMVEYAQDMLVNRGYTSGLITTQKGLLVDLGTYDAGGYNMFTVDEGKIYLKETVKVPAGGKMSGICVVPFSETEENYYCIEKDGMRYYRNPFVALTEGGFTNYVESSYVASTERSIVDVMYTNITINSLEKGENSEGAEITGDGMEIYIVDKR